VARKPTKVAAIANRMLPDRTVEAALFFASELDGLAAELAAEVAGSELLVDEPVAVDEEAVGAEPATDRETDGAAVGAGIIPGGIAAPPAGIPPAPGDMPPGGISPPGAAPPTAPPAGGAPSGAPPAAAPPEASPPGAIPVTFAHSTLTPFRTSANAVALVISEGAGQALHCSMSPTVSFVQTQVVSCRAAIFAWSKDVGIEVIEDLQVMAAVRSCVHGAHMSAAAKPASRVIARTEVFILYHTGIKTGSRNRPDGNCLIHMPK